ncbi:MAG TPA: hypothetical protein VGG28_20310 [Kofleriaceae bacterium]
MRACLLSIIACACNHAPSGGPGSGSDAGSGGKPIDAMPIMPGQLAIGGHAITYEPFNSSHGTTISTPAFDTQATGSTMIVGIGRGVGSAFTAQQRTPTDNKGNSPYVIEGSEEHWSLYPQSSAATYAFSNMVGGAGQVISTMAPATDEITVMAVEVANATKVSAVFVEEREAPLTSMSITTSGPAALIAYWWGDNDADMRTATPNNDFQVLDSILTQGELVEGAVAAKIVNAAGTYDVTWSATPPQGALLWLVAVEP